MKKLMSLLLILCVLHVLAGTPGIAAYLFSTGRLDGMKMRVIADLARHQGTPEKLREKVGEILAPAPATTSAPASQRSLTAPGTDTAAAPLVGDPGNRINFARRLVEQERIALESQKQELLHRQNRSKI